MRESFDVTSIVDKTRSCETIEKRDGRSGMKLTHRYDPKGITIIQTTHFAIVKWMRKNPC